MAADNESLLEYAFRFQGTVAFRTLIDIFDSPAAGWNAVWCLIHQNLLIPARSDMKLIDAPFVHFNHQAGSDPAFFLPFEGGQFLRPLSDAEMIAL